MYLDPFSPPLVQGLILALVISNYLNAFFLKFESRVFLFKTDSGYPKVAGEEAMANP